MLKMGTIKSRKQVKKYIVLWQFGSFCVCFAHVWKVGISEGVISKHSSIVALSLKRNSFHMVTGSLRQDPLCLATLAPNAFANPAFPRGNAEQILRSSCLDFLAYKDLETEMNGLCRDLEINLQPHNSLDFEFGEQKSYGSPS